MTGSSTESGTTVSEYDNMRSCTDRNGVTFRKGEAGFSDCISWMKENRKGDMSGQAGSQTMPPTNGTSSGDLGTTDSGTGSDTGASGSTTDSGSTTPSS